MSGLVSRPLKVLLSGFGSRGDVQPLLLSAMALRDAGHQPQLCVPVNYVDRVRAMGLDVVSGGMDLDDYRTTPGTRDANGEMIRFVCEAIDAQRRVVAPLARKADVYACGLGDFLGPSIAESARVPLARLAYAPPFRSARPSVLFPTHADRAWLNRALWRLQEVALNVVVGRLVNRARLKMGLARVRDVVGHGQRQGVTLLAYEDALAPSPEAWAGRYRYAPVGYCTPPDDLDPFPEALDRFLSCPGGPIVYVGFGSMNTANARAQASMIVEAAGRAGCRVVVGRGRAQLSVPEGSARPEDAIFVDAVSHGRLFPRLAGVVHHGGSGTTHTAAHAGVPQAVVHHLADQKFWGTMVHRRGAGPRPTSIGKLEVGRLATIFSDLAHVRRFRRGAQALALQMSTSSAPQRIASQLAGMA